jgi:Ca2+-binding RTX toxin-like protein
MTRFTKASLRRTGVGVLAAAGLAAAQLALFGGAAQAAPPSSVWIEGGGLRVLSPAGQSNAIFLSPAPGQVFVRDLIGNVAAQFPCVAVDAHTARCPAGGIAFFTVDTGDGNDRITNRTALLGRIVAGSGNDITDDGPGNQSIDLGSGNDFALVGGGRDAVFGGLGFDTTSYANRVANVQVRLDNAANDGQAGEQDNISITVERTFGGAGNDVMVGNNLSNWMYGLGGLDLIATFGANDFIDGGLGRDNMFGGAGVDQVSYAGRAANVQVRLDNFANDGQGGENDNAHSDIENVTGGNGNDLLIGSGANNVIRGLGGSDSLHGLGGNDLLFGDAGVDFAHGGLGADGCVAEIEVSC